MNGALEFLRSLDGINYGTDAPKEKLEKAIAELEEAMKPKSCFTCKHFRNMDKACFESSQNTYLRPASIDFSGCGKHEPKEQL